MSSENKGRRTTVTVDDSIMTGLEEFCELYEITGKSNAVETLLAIAEASGIPLHENDVTEQTRELSISNVNDVRGFVLSNNDSQLQLIGTDASSAVTITNTSTPSSSIQPLPRTNITKGNVICPACNSNLFSFDLSDSFPGIDSGIFNSLSIHCQKCDSHRPHYTLFVGQPGSSTSVNVLMNLMESHFAFLLVTEAQTQQTFNERIVACKSLADDGGVQWLPSPSKWIGYEVKTLNYPAVSNEMYLEFLKNYIVYLINQEESVQIIEGLLEDVEGTNEKQLKIETRGKEPDSVFTTLQNYTTHWEEFGIETREVDENTFADNTYFVRLNRE